MELRDGIRQQDYMAKKLIKTYLNDLKYPTSPDRKAQGICATFRQDLQPAHAEEAIYF